MLFRFRWCKQVKEARISISFTKSGFVFAKGARMKNVLGLVLLLLAGSVASGFISSVDAKRIVNSHISVPFDSVEDKKAAKVFPVAGRKSRIASFWGAIRDGGARKHEGIDIFAPRKTPVLAVRDGIITTTGNGGRGGKYIWLKASGDKFNYYYAHLDKQYVKPGQKVKAGQVIGTVGNTGNARFTPAHLHFGMYSRAGAVDPLPYVKNLPKLPLSSLAPEQDAIVTDSAKKAPTDLAVGDKYIWKK